MKTEKLKENWTKFSSQIKAMSKKKKILIGSIAGAVIVFAVVATLLLNGNNAEYKVLYENIEATESTQVYKALKDLGAEVQLDSDGKVMVKTGEYDMWLFQLAEKGYPRTGLAYDLFSSNSGMTTTEAESKQWLLYQLQDRIQDTLKILDGVNNAIVTINLAEESDYVWQQATEEEESTASVLLTLEPGKNLSTEQVASIKNLVAASAPGLDSKQVTLVDANTSIELEGETNINGISVAQNLNFEHTVQTQMENNIKRLLTPRYGADGVIPVVKVTINYDKMISEQMDLREKPDGGGYVTHTEGDYKIEGSEPISGIAGEQPNTDVPTYGYQENNGGEDETYFAWGTDIDYSYLKTQIEKGNATLERATVSVMVKETNLTQPRRDELVNLISKSVDIPQEEIMVSSIDSTIVEKPTEPGPEKEDSIFDSIPIWAYFAAAAVLILIVVLIIMIVLKKKKKKKLLALQSAMDEEEKQRQLEDEISAYKKQLVDGVKSDDDAKDEAIMEEVRDFAKTNPEITANLLRSWLKED